jgi:hypothetical protein
MPESKATTKKRSRKSTTSKKHLQPASAQDSNASAGEKQQMINEAAYFIAEQRGFTPGSELNDWLYAESQIDNNPAQQGE